MVCAVTVVWHRSSGGCGLSRLLPGTRCPSGSLWTGDSLHSIGIFIPPLSILLTLRGSREAARDAAGKAAEIAEAGIDEMLSYYAIRLYSDQIVSQGRRRNSLYDRKTPGGIFQPGG